MEYGARHRAGRRALAVGTVQEVPKAVAGNLLFVREQEAQSCCARGVYGLANGFHHLASVIQAGVWTGLQFLHWTSVPGAWRHAGVQFPLTGACGVF